MAKNLRAKIPATDTLIIRDVNEDASKRFVEEARETAGSAGAAGDTYKVEIAGCPREMAEKSVSDIYLVCVSESVVSLLMIFFNGRQQRLQAFRSLNTSKACSIRSSRTVIFLPWSKNACLLMHRQSIRFRPKKSQMKSTQQAQGASLTHLCLEE